MKETFTNNNNDVGQTICIPFQSNDGIFDRRDAWRTWSCIRLSYLLRDTLISLSNCSLDPNAKMDATQKLRFYVKYGNKLKKRHPKSPYLTRREGKYCWLTVKDVQKDNDYN